MSYGLNVVLSSTEKNYEDEEPTTKPDSDNKYLWIILFIVILLIFINHFVYTHE